MSKRLQVLFGEAELGEVREAARRRGMPVSEWVRQALREARGREPSGDLDTKLRAVREGARHQGPTADIEQLLAEIERGRHGSLPE